MLTDEERELQEVIRQLQDIDLRCTRRESSIDHITTFVPRPGNPLPYHPLPRWVNLPLDHKLPIVPCPPGMFHLSLNSIGDSIYENIPGCYFDNEDPYIRRTPLGYDSLSDPNLRDFFVQRPNLLKRLERRGLINECGSVPCSVKEFNKYRDYLARLYSKDVQKEKDRWEQWSAENSKQEKKIRLAAIREATAEKEVRTKTRMEKHRAARERKQIMMQLKGFFHPCSAKTAAVSEERQLLASQREARRLQRDLRIAKIRKVEDDRRKELVMQWYCRDMYLHKFRKCLKEWHKQKKICDLQSFIRYKREYQNQKLRYEKAINLRYKAEHQCAVKRRIKHFDYVERHRKELLKLNAVDKEHRKAREIYLMKKYGRRWLAATAEKRNNEETFHDSLWHIRYDLRHMVNLLREESGAVSFSNFIQGLVKLAKPHRETIQMTPETKTAVDYVLGVLLDNTFKEFVRKKASCAINFLSEEVRKKISGKGCRHGEAIPLADFFPPKLIKRFKPQSPFERPPWPCTGPCAQYASKETKADKKWKKKCMEMAHAMNLAHDRISTYLTDRMFRAQQAKACADLYDPCGLPCLADVHNCEPEPPDQMRWIDELLNKQRKNLSFQQKLWPEEQEDFQEAAKWSDVPRGRKGRRRRKDMQLDCEDKLARKAQKSSLICEPREETKAEEEVAPQEKSKKKRKAVEKKKQTRKEAPPTAVEAEAPPPEEETVKVEEAAAVVAPPKPKKPPGEATKKDDRPPTQTAEVSEEATRPSKVIEKPPPSKQTPVAVEVKDKPKEEKASTSKVVEEVKAKSEAVIVKKEEPKAAGKTQPTATKVEEFRPVEVTKSAAASAAATPQESVTAMPQKSAAATPQESVAPTPKESVAEIVETVEVKEDGLPPTDELPSEETPQELISEVGKGPPPPMKVVESLTKAAIPPQAVEQVERAPKTTEGQSGQSELPDEAAVVEEAKKEVSRAALEQLPTETSDVPTEAAGPAKTQVSQPPSQTRQDGGLTVEVSEEAAGPSEQLKADSGQPSRAVSVQPSAAVLGQPSPVASTKSSPVASAKSSPITSSAVLGQPSPVASAKSSPVASAQPSGTVSAQLSEAASAQLSAAVSAQPSPVASAQPSVVATAQPSPIASVRPSAVSTTEEVPVEVIAPIKEDLSVSSSETAQGTTGELSTRPSETAQGTTGELSTRPSEIVEEANKGDASLRPSEAAAAAAPTEEIIAEVAPMEVEVTPDAVATAEEVSGPAKEDIISRTPSQAATLEQPQETGGDQPGQSEGPTDDLNLKWVDEIVIEERRRLSELQKWKGDEDEGPEEATGAQGLTQQPAEETDELDLKWVDKIVIEERRRLSELQKWRDDEDGIPVEGPKDATGDQGTSSEGAEDDLRWVNEIIKEERRKLSQLQIRPEDDEDLATSRSHPHFVDPIIEGERKRLQDQSDALKTLKGVENEEDDMRWVNELIEREREKLALLAVRPEERSTASSLASFVPPILERERIGLQDQSDALQVIVDNSDSDMEDEAEISGRVAAGDSPETPLDVTELMAATVGKTHSDSSSNSEDDDMKWVTEIVREERRKLSMLRANMPQQQDSDQVTTASSDARFVSRIVETQRKSLEEDRTIGQSSFPEAQDHGDITQLSGYNISQWVNLPMLNLTEPTPSTTSESDMSWVDEIVHDERRSLSKQLHLIRGDEIKVESVETEDTRKVSEGSLAVTSMLSPDSAFPSEDSVTLDPNEEGISVTRSEIRRQLNLMSEELEAIKAQLMEQGYLPPSSEDPPPGPSGS